MKVSFFPALLCVLTAIPSFASSSLDKEITKIIKKSKKPVHIGVVIRQAKTGKVIYNRKGNYLFAPASVQKLLTATAALHYLGPSFSFKTKLFTSGKKTNGTLKGNLLVQFNGDPELTADDLESLIEALKENGITKIKGKVFIDTSAYDSLYYPPGWVWDDLSYSYAAPLSAAIIDKNAFILRLTPNVKIGAPPTLSVDIPNQTVHFTNHIKTTKTFNKECPVTIYSDFNNHYMLSGCLNKNWGRQRRNVALRDPVPYISTLLIEDLKENNITYSGKISSHKTNKQYKLLAEHDSAPLRKILKDMLKKSDNLISDSLLKQIGHRYFHQPGSWSNGVKAMTKILAETKIDFKGNLIDDGAGLSRYNLLSPYQLSELLQYVYHKPSLRRVLIQALPIAGIDGTLVERMISEAKDKRIRAKTGSMTGITSLAGYIYTKNLGVLTFAIMINGFVGKRHPYTKLEDKLCKFLAGYSQQRHHG